MAINCFRYFGFQSLEQVNKLTIPEYELLMEALELRQVDQEYWTHWQAFLNYAVKAEKRVGKNKTRPVYQKFSKFFDYERQIDRVKNKKKSQDRFSGIGRFLKKGG